jgi:hypothetical protein
MTYLPSHKLHKTVFGTNIVIEGIGDVHIRVVVSGKSILFRFRDSWHVPSSPHHFLSCSTVISLGNQVMIAGHSPRMIFSHKRRLVAPNLPKYMPFTRMGGLIILKFAIPAQDSLSPSPQHASESTTTRFTSIHVNSTVLSLPALPYHPFAGIALTHDTRNPLPSLPTSHSVSFPGSPSQPSAREITVAISVHMHADVISDITAGPGAVLHGGADSQMPVDVLVDGIFIRDASAEDRACFALYDDDATITSHGGPDASVPLLLPVDVTLCDIEHGDAADQGANSAYMVEVDLLVRLSPLSSLRTSCLSRSFPFVLNTYSPFFPGSRLPFPWNTSSFYSSSFFAIYTLPFSFSTLVQQLLIPFFSSNFWVFIPLLCYFSLPGSRHHRHAVLFHHLFCQWIRAGFSIALGARILRVELVC